TSDPCKSNSCGRDASCVNLFSDHYCLCPQGYYYRNLSCVKAPECSEPCNAQEGKQCVRTNGKSECVCMPGYQKNSDKCEECPFGYSGTDCKDQFQLILTIVGTIAGALILILLIALIVSVSSKKKKKNVEEQQLIEDDFRNIRLQQGGFSNSGFSNSGFSNFGGDSSSIFPKVRTGVPSQTQNPYANQRSMSRPDY
ncbi:Mucin-13, partial [Cricetulus griseus]